MCKFHSKISVWLTKKQRWGDATVWQYSILIDRPWIGCTEEKMRTLLRACGPHILSTQTRFEYVSLPKRNAWCSSVYFLNNNKPKLCPLSRNWDLLKTHHETYLTYEVATGALFSDDCRGLVFVTRPSRTLTTWKPCRHCNADRAFMSNAMISSAERWLTQWVQNLNQIIGVWVESNSNSLHFKWGRSRLFNWGGIH